MSARAAGTSSVQSSATFAAGTTGGSAGAAAGRSGLIGGAEADHGAGAGAGAGSGGQQHFSSALAASRQEQAAGTRRHSEPASTDTAAHRPTRAGSSATTTASDKENRGATVGATDRSGADGATGASATTGAAGAGALAVQANGADVEAPAGPRGTDAGGNVKTEATVSSTDSALTAVGDVVVSAVVDTAGTAKAGAAKGGTGGRNVKTHGNASAGDSSVSASELAALAMMLGIVPPAVPGSSGASDGDDAAGEDSAVSAVAADAGGGSVIAAGGTNTVGTGVAGANSGSPAVPAPVVSSGAGVLNDAVAAQLSGRSAAAAPAVKVLAAIGTNPNPPPTATATAAAPSALPQLLQHLGVAAALTGAGEMTRGALTLSLPVSDPNWPQALATQVHWLASSQIQSATLTLSPEHLGPLEVRIDLQHSQVNVTFNAAHADTRAALAEAVPRLRAMFAAGGLSLGQASVQQGPHSGAQSPRQARVGSAAAQSAVAKTVEPVSIGAIQALGLVDEYI